MQGQRLRRLFFKGSLFVAAGILLLLVYNFFGKGIPCLWHALTGLYCPGCGSMRALVSLTQLEFYQALRYNALLVLSLPVIAAELLRSAVNYVRGRNTRAGKLQLAAIIIFAAGSVGYGILRNLAQFAFLAPTPLAA